METRQAHSRMQHHHKTCRSKEVRETIITTLPSSMRGFYRRNYKCAFILCCSSQSISCVYRLRFRDKIIKHVTLAVLGLLLLRITNYNNQAQFTTRMWVRAGHIAYYSNEFVLVWQFLKSNPQHDLRNLLVKDVVASVDSGSCCCSITRMWSLHVEKALKDRKRTEDVLILARESSSVARIHDTISCSLL